MPKPELEFFDASAVEWTPVNMVRGLSQRVLAVDSETRIATRLLKFEPGTDTSLAGVQSHLYWEEVYILEGYLHDLTLNQTFRAGSYACRPPGMKHGPWKAPEGCLNFEVRYYTGNPQGGRP